MPFTISATGHRPNRLGGYNTVTEHRLARVATLGLEQVISQYRGRAPFQVISGLALGWDTAIAQASFHLGIPLICAIPFPNQPSRWPAHEVAVWAEIRRRAAEVHVISPEFTPEALQLRNQWMVDRADLVLALYKGGHGGTGNCVAYARSKGVPILNLWKQYKLETL